MDFLIQYRIREGAEAAQDAAVRAFVAAIRATGDAACRYTVYRRQDDGRAFVHHAWLADQAAFARFQAQPHFKAFADGLGARVEAPPTVARLDPVISSGG